MKWTVVAVFAVLAASLAHAQDAGTLGKVKSTGALTLGVRDASIPFSFVDQNQNAVGYSVDLCMKVAEAVKHEWQSRKGDDDRPQIGRHICCGVYKDPTLERSVALSSCVHERSG